MTNLSQNLTDLLHRYLSETERGHQLIGLVLSYLNSGDDQLRNLAYEKDESITWTYYLLSDSLNLSSGDYEVLPYLLIRHDQIPIGLIDAHGGDSVLTLSAYFLDLPFDILPDTLQIN